MTYARDTVAIPEYTGLPSPEIALSNRQARVLASRGRLLMP